MIFKVFLINILFLTISYGRDKNQSSYERAYAPRTVISGHVKHSASGTQVCVKNRCSGSRGGNRSDYSASTKRKIHDHLRDQRRTRCHQRPCPN